MNISKKRAKSDDEPDIITSYGVININITAPLYSYMEIIKHAFHDIDCQVNISNVICESSEEFMELRNLVSNSLLFLLVSRRHSLGFIEYIRGRYNPDNFEEVNHLFIQMTDNEIKDIFSKEFDNLWNSMWKKNAKKTSYHKEYIIAKEKHQKIIDTLNFKLFLPKYPNREWGFPKGRKNSSETNIACAIRECCEETSLFKSEISILSGIKPLTEIMTGTNGVQYKHVYYLSMLDSIRTLDVYNDDVNFIEIDTVGWFKKERAINLLRPYHTEKHKIIDKIIDFITYAIYCAKNDISVY